MKLTKGLIWAMVCAGATAFTVSAQNVWVDDAFDFPSEVGENIWGVSGPDWSRSGLNDDSKIVQADAARLAFNVISTPLTNATDTLVLELNTEGDTLIRTLPNGISFDNDRTDPVNLLPQPVYVDMMVKFVLSEEFPDEPDTAVKALLFAKANEVTGIPYLQVWNGTGVDGQFTELDAVIDPEQWYRLTLTWDYWDADYMAMFSIHLNGKLLISGDGWTDKEDPLGAWASPGPWFMTAALDTTDTTLSSIEFQGTGFIDELVVTDVAPDFGEPGTDDNYNFASSGTIVSAKAFNAWVALYNVQGSENAKMLTAFLLNVAPGDGSEEAKLAIKSIVPKASGIFNKDTSTTGPGATVTLVAIDGTDNEVAFANPNGVLRVYRKASLEDPWGSAAYIYELKPNTDVYDVPGDTDKYFYMATISDK